jgi:protein-S-isoprenylcysteine O-methyltransferase Ste14
MALYLGVVLFIKKEESKLKEIFGKEYEVYLSRVNRIFPFVKIKK